MKINQSSTKLHCSFLLTYSSPENGLNSEVRSDDDGGKEAIAFLSSPDAIEFLTQRSGQSVRPCAVERHAPTPQHNEPQRTQAAMAYTGVAHLHL